MDFTLSDDRRMLRETLSRYLAEQYPIAHRNAVAYAPPFHDPSKWAEMADLGILHALVPEDRGGIGGTGFDILVVFEALGAALCPEPFLGALMAARLIPDTSDLLTGQTRYAVALFEADGETEVADVETTAENSRLTGRKSVVYGGGVADRILVSAQGDGVALYEVAAQDAEITSYGMVDGGNAAEVFLTDTPAKLVLPDAEERLQDAIDHGALALAAEAVGAMDAAFEMLTEYLRTRQQFGRPIGNFQALQHRAVDVKIEIEQARSIVTLAASRMGTPQQTRTVSMAKSLVGRVARQVAEEVIQMHGGIAMTWEFPASHYAKRLVMIDHQLGGSDAHLQRVAADYRG